MKRNDNRYDKAFKTAASSILLALLLSGCAQGNPVKTQPIASMESSSGHQTEAAAFLPSDPVKAAETESSPAASDVTSGLEADAESYYRAKAEQDALHIDISKLEADFRVGKLSREDFLTEKSQLEAQKDALDQEEDRLERSLDRAYYQSSPAIPSGNLEELRSMASELEKKEQRLESQEDTLEQSYWAGEITRDDFISQQIEIIRNEENLDREEELLEEAMESMGFDD